MLKLLEIENNQTLRQKTRIRKQTEQNITTHDTLQWKLNVPTYQPTYSCKLDRYQKAKLYHTLELCIKFQQQNQLVQIESKSYWEYSLDNFFYRHVVVLNLQNVAACSLSFNFFGFNLKKLKSSSPPTATTYQPTNVQCIYFVSNEIKASQWDMIFVYCFF